MAKGKSFDRILEECIRQMEASGGGMEAVLAAHPEHASELRPHLELRASLSSVRAAEASPEAMAGGRQRLLRAMAAAGAGGETSREALKIGGPMLRFIAVFVAGAAVTLGIAFLGGALDFGSGGSTAEAGPVLDCVLQLDFNHDGMLNVQDVAAFKDAIKSQDPAFDFNSDGVVDIFDAVAAVKGVIECLQQIQPPPPPTPTPV